MTKTIPTLFFGLLLAAPLSSTAGEGQPYYKARHTLGVGATYQSADAELRATVDPLPEASLDLDDLGMDTDDLSWALEWRWRFKPKWMLVALAYTFDEDGNRSIERDFNYDGKEFQAGASLDTEFSIDTYILDLMYSVYQGDKLEILLGGGIHAIDMDAAISGRAFVGEVERERATGASDLLAPLPNVRAQAFYSFGGEGGWAAGISMGWLSANYDNYEGSFVYVHPRIGYAFTDNWAVTAGYQFVDIDVTHEKSRTRETELNVEFTGPTLFLNYRF